MDQVKEKIANLETQISAVDCFLRNFIGKDNEEERQKKAQASIADVQYVKLYAHYSEEDLIYEKQQLQDRTTILGAHLRGRSYFYDFLHFDLFDHLFIYPAYLRAENKDTFFPGKYSWCCE
jgi:hypothetical protein